MSQPQAEATDRIPWKEKLQPSSPILTGLALGNVIVAASLSNLRATLAWIVVILLSLAWKPKR